MLIFMLFFSSLSQNVELIQELGEILLMESESVKLNLYDYFFGEYLTFSSNSSGLNMPGPLKIKESQKHSYHKPYSDPIIGSEFLVFDSENTTYLIDFQGSILFLYTISSSKQILSYESSADIGFPISQVTYWDNLGQLNLLVLCQSSKNLVFLLDFPEIQNSDVMLIPLWDLYYIKGLKTCNFVNTTFISFVGNTYSDHGMLLIYDFTEPLLPNLIYYVQHPYEDINEKFVPIDLISIIYDDTLTQLVVLNEVFGLEVIIFNNYIFSTTARIQLTEFSCLINMHRVTSKVYSNVEYNFFPISVSTCKGVVVVDFFSNMPMFFLKGVNESGSIFGALNVVAIDNIFFYMLSNFAFVIAIDRGTSQDLIYYLNLTKEVSSSAGYLKWTVFFIENSYVLIASDSKSITLYSLNFSLPTAEISRYCGDEEINITASNYLNKSVSSVLKINQLDNFDIIEFIYAYRLRECNDTEIQVIFEGFSQLIDFPVYDYISGRNMSFEFIQYIYDDNFAIVPGDFAKVSYKTQIPINSTCQQILFTKMQYFLVYTDSIEIYSSIDSKFIQTISVENLILTYAIGNYVFMTFYNSSGNYLEVYTFGRIDVVETQVMCNFLQMVLDTLICAGDKLLQMFAIYSGLINSSSTYTFPLSLNTQIISIALFVFDPELFKSHLYVLTSDGEITLFSLNNNLPSFNLIQSFSVTDFSSILASQQHLYVITDYSIDIYLNMQIIRSIPFTQKIVLSYLLMNFVYAITEDGELVMVDGLQSVMNSYFWETNVEKNCTFSNPWFDSKNKPLFGFLCQDQNSEKVFYIYQSKCPNHYDVSYCTISLPLEITLNYPNQTNTDIYPQMILILASNDFSNKDLYVTLDLVVYGQAVALINPDSIKKSISIEYNVGFSDYMLDIFTGNNMELSLFIKNNIIEPDSEYNPLKLKPNLSTTSIYNTTNNDILMGMTSISNTPIIVVATLNGKIIFMNSSSDGQTNKMKTIGFIDIKIFFGSQGQCWPIKYITGDDDVILLASACLNISVFDIYWENNYYRNSSTIENFLTIWKINKQTYEVLDIYNHKINFSPQALQVITDNYSVFTILLINNLAIYYMPSTSNNNIYRVSYLWSQGSLTIQSKELINFYSLGLYSFYAVSVDGYYIDCLYIAVAEYRHGLFLLKVINETAVIHSYANSDSNDPLVSVGMAYKIIFTVSQSGLLVNYRLNNNAELVFNVQRFPFTTVDSEIRSVTSSVTFSEEFYFQYIAYPVVYDNSYYKYRLIDTYTSFANCLIRDVLFLNGTLSTLFNTNIEAVFIDKNTVSFIVNNVDIVCLFLDDYVLECPQMTEDYYNKMVDKWNTSEFDFTVVAGNDNNKLSMGEIHLSVTMKSEHKDDDVSSTPWWIFLVIAAGIFIVLIITVKLVYKCIFRKWKIRKMRLESQVGQNRPNTLILNFSLYEDK
ncbi:hypothetical protein SteCoe_10115 [Stentor coeruleus]|uniref:Uncharacterized protein n=1 Tax=Stentor coeruleus TaxID=5963 RepID=A0A1R2CGB5_9CILI|nr:hypothetical protein SteCoe_10115 [Stentor coeruleus]